MLFRSKRQQQQQTTAVTRLQNTEGTMKTLSGTIALLLLLLQSATAALPGVSPLCYAVSPWFLDTDLSCNVERHDKLECGKDYQWTSVGAGPDSSQLACIPTEICMCNRFGNAKWDCREAQLSADLSLAFGGGTGGGRCQSKRERRAEQAEGAATALVARPEDAVDPGVKPPFPTPPGPRPRSGQPLSAAAASARGKRASC